MFHPFEHEQRKGSTYQKSVNRFWSAALVALVSTHVLPHPASAQSTETLQITHSIRGQRVTLRPVIHWPKGAAPFSVVVVVNNSAGARDHFFKLTPPQMNKAGIAVVILDTFTPRGIQGTGTNQKKLTPTRMAYDALATAQVLRQNQRIRANRIALQGHSKGAVTALYIGFAAWHDWAGSRAKSFNALIAFSPTCELQFRDPKLTAPLLAMLGEKDDYTLPGPCVKLFKRMKSSRQPVAWQVVPGAYHSWSTTGVHFNAALWTAKKCADAPLYYTRRGFQSSTDNSIIPFRQFYRHCGTHGARVGGNGELRGYVIAEAIKWLKARGW